ncbi:hypothetical protein M5689_013587 [Euphorbia peplus]|nr:hypothetical protein M5689_013587 [Euphorbia peplus]
MYEYLIIFHQALIQPHSFIGIILFKLFNTYNGFGCVGSEIGEAMEKHADVLEKVSDSNNAMRDKRNGSTLCYST